MTLSELRRASIGLTLGGVLLAGGVACSDQDGPGDAEWPSSTSPVEATGLVWAVGNEVHLPDGSTIDTGRAAGSYVVGGPGVWFTSAEVGDLEPNRLPPLRLATAGGVEEMDAHPHIGSLTASTDGHWLVFLDRLDGGSGAAEAVVVDLTTGEEVVRSQEGLVPQDTAGADWTDLYEDAPVYVLGIADDTAYITGLSTLVAHDLSTGESRSTELDWGEIRSSEWYQDLYGEAPLWNGDRSWSIPAHEYDALPVLVAAGGERLATTVREPTGPDGFPDFFGPSLETWVVGGWIDDVTALGLTPARDGTSDSWRSPVLLTCTVPKGVCEVMPGTEDGVNLPVDRPYGVPRERSLNPS